MSNKLNDAVAARIARLRELMAERGYDAVLLRNNSDLRWLTGASRVFDFEIAHTALITPEHAWLHTDSRYFGSFIERLGEDGPWAIDMTTQTHALWAAHLIRSERLRVVAIEDTLELGFFDELQVELGKASAACLLPRLHSDIAIMRAIKDEEELALLRRAQEITDDAFDHICSFIKPGMTELQIRAELEGYMLSHGAHGLSFDSIVGSGPNGANPHARPSERVVKEGDLIVLDYGALYGDYHADMTRTVCVGTPSEEQLAVYAVVRRAHEECAKAFAAGKSARAVHELAVQVIRDAGYGDYFAHGLGHGVGIDIHERPSVGGRSEDTLEVGAVFTDEPGIYLPGKFGIRLEDTGVLTENGFESFARSTHDLVCVG